MNLIFRHIALVIFLLVATSSVAQVMLPSAQSNRSEMLIGEQAEITVLLELELENDWPKIQFPYYEDELTPGLEIVEASPVDTTNPNANSPNLYQLKQKYTVTAWDSGMYEVPRFGLVVDGDSLYSNSIRLAVNTVQVDTTQAAIFDIKDIYAVELTWQDYLSLYGWIVALILFGGAAIVLAWYFLSRPKLSSDQKAEKPAPKIPAHVIALEELEKLAVGKPWINGDLKRYHTDLCDILRDYIEDRFLVPAHEQTSNEILANLRFTEMPDDAMLRIRHVLKLADMVKFAKEKPGSAENERSLQLAKEYVELTKAPEKPDEPESEESEEKEQKPVNRAPR